MRLDASVVVDRHVEGPRIDAFDLVGGDVKRPGYGELEFLMSHHVAGRRACFGSEILTMCFEGETASNLAACGVPPTNVTPPVVVIALVFAFRIAVPAVVTASMPKSMSCSLLRLPGRKIAAVPLAGVGTPTGAACAAAGHSNGSSAARRRRDRRHISPAR